MIMSHILKEQKTGFIFTIHVKVIWPTLLLCPRIDLSLGADTITINPLHLQNGPRNLKEDHFLTQKPPSELFSNELLKSPLALWT